MKDNILLAKIAGLMIGVCLFSIWVTVLLCNPLIQTASEPDHPEDTAYTVYLIVKDEDEVSSSTETDEPAESTFTEEEMRLIAQLVMAEAENQSELGKRLVIDTVLNRVDHPDPQFPDTVYEVIYQKNQFSPVASGSFDRCYVTEENLQLVREEIERRTDHDVIYFRAGKYGNYGVPMYCVGDHYFSSFS